MKLSEKVNKWEYEYGKLLIAIVSHYINVGEQTWEKVTPEEIENIKNEPQSDAIITNDFKYMFIKACYNLNHEEAAVKEKLIRKYYRA